MVASYSKLTAKSQTVIPLEVRNRLGIKPGDWLCYRITSKGIRLQKASIRSQFAAFDEWASDADERAFKSL